MSTSADCPFCACYDTRPINDPDAEIVGFRCHDCARTFFVSGTKAPSMTGTRNEETLLANVPRATPWPKFTLSDSRKRMSACGESLARTQSRIRDCQNLITESLIRLRELDNTRRARE